MIASLKLFLAIIVVAYTKRHGHHRHRGNQKRGDVGEYDLFIFSAEVPGSVCSHRKCKQSMLGDLPAKGLNMHGLWPQNNDGNLYSSQFHLIF